MHLFFESVWKLHIGEIPEKPREPIHIYRRSQNESPDYYLDLERYEYDVAVIKQNALTVGNPEVIRQLHPMYGGPISNGGVYQPDEFYKWPGDFEMQDINNHPDKDPDYVAILTLPEEKKNTMENMTWISLKSEWPEETENVLWCTMPVEEPYWFGCIVDDDWRESYTHWMRISDPERASDSVAAPKRVCPKCGSGKVIMFTSDDDLCQTCGATFPGVLNGLSELASLRQQLKEREEALKELLPLAEQYRTKIDNPNWEDDFNKSKAIIEKARKLISK